MSITAFHPLIYLLPIIASSFPSYTPPEVPWQTANLFKMSGSASSADWCECGFRRGNPRPSPLQRVSFTYLIGLCGSKPPGTSSFSRPADFNVCYSQALVSCGWMTALLLHVVWRLHADVYFQLLWLNDRYLLYILTKVWLPSPNALVIAGPCMWWTSFVYARNESASPQCRTHSAQYPYSVTRASWGERPIWESRILERRAILCLPFCLCRFKLKK